MTRIASDNRYLHKDFHAALSMGIEYLDHRLSPQAVRDYLCQFARAFYRPLTQDLASRGLIALQEHFERIYQVEGAEVSVRLREDELVVEVQRCPAVSYMREHGRPVARLFCETTRAVNEAVCEGTDFEAELVRYDERTGASVQRFCRRKA